ncbi:hypothetical protein [Leptospira sarikeiensis]|nr:hypothetical protein [Leptospira sarikeiensis]
MDIIPEDKIEKEEPQSQQSETAKERKIEPKLPGIYDPWHID